MSNIPEVYLLQATRKHLEQARAFQDDMGGHFFEHTIYDVKDALTSILALCDMEDMKQVPQVKKYIQRVTDLLHDVRLYSSSSVFNVNHVAINIVNILKNHYKSKMAVSHQFTTIKAYACSNKSHLERMVLYTLIEALESVQEEQLGMEISLVQKDYDAVISIRLKNFRYTSVVLKEIRSFHKENAFVMQINESSQDTEILIRVPLSFDAKETAEAKAENALNVTLGELKIAQKPQKDSVTERSSQAENAMHPGKSALRTGRS